VTSPKKKPALVGRSPLRAVVLAVVLERPGRGYQIAAYLRWRLGPSWRIYAKHLYPVLEALEAEGLVWSEDVPANERNGGTRSKKDRKIYYPTPAAAPARAEWIQAPISLGIMRPDIHARLVFSQRDEAPLVLGLLDEYEQEVVGALQANADAESPPASWQGRMISRARASLAQQLDGELLWISETRGDIEKFLESR
jgi:DNA-binding PadR family transcriptional regulator